ncbi:MAG: potassium-transporting ATPase subunit KdpA, partial [Aquabacterium sp.]
MTTHAWLLLAAFLAVLLVLARPLGGYIAGVMDGTPPAFMRWLRPVERAIHRLCGTKPDAETGWLAYALGLLLFNLAGAVFVYALQRLQGGLPLNPQHLGAVSPDSSFNTAISFVSNTNWQGYAGESTMSYLTQMLGLAVQNFLSAASGIAVVVALIRGFARAGSATVGNVWSDLTRSTLYVLLPLSMLLAVFLVGQGVIQ